MYEKCVLNMKFKLATSSRVDLALSLSNLGLAVYRSLPKLTTNSETSYNFFERRGRRDVLQHLTIFRNRRNFLVACHDG
jgi:hypothetical protein